MKRTTVLTAAISAASALAAMIGVETRAGGEPDAFPARLAEAIHYHSTDNAKAKQRRELYATPDAIAAVKAGRPIPAGAVLAMQMFKARLDADGNPAEDENGRYIKEGLISYGVMVMRPGGDAGQSPATGSGGWEYRSFTPDKAVNAKANLDACLECHKSQERTGYVFSLARMRDARP